MGTITKTLSRALGLIGRWLWRAMIGFLIFMACAILWNLAEYGIQELKDGDVSFKPKGWQYDRPTEVSR